jgi:hypothetical protein
MLTRLYSIADADMKQLADGLAISITRDIEDFGTRNIDTRTVDDLRLLTNTFDDASTDQELLGLVVDATATKDSIVEKSTRPFVLYATWQNMRLMARDSTKPLALKT